MNTVNVSMKHANQCTVAGWSCVSSVPPPSSLLPTICSVSPLDHLFTAHHTPKCDLLGNLSVNEERTVPACDFPWLEWVLRVSLSDLTLLAGWLTEMAFNVYKAFGQ